MAGLRRAPGACGAAFGVGSGPLNGAEVAAKAHRRGRRRVNPQDQDAFAGPEFTGLAHRLSSEIIEMPTCAVAEFCFDTKAWSDVGELEPVKVAADYPKK